MVVVDECRATGAGVADAIVADLAEQRIGRRLASIRAVDSFVPLGPATSAVLVGVDQIVAASVAAVRSAGAVTPPAHDHDARGRRLPGARLVRARVAALAARAGIPGSAAPTSCAAEYDLPPLSALDGAARFDPAVHLRSANASPLTFLSRPARRRAHRRRPRSRGGGGQLDRLVHGARRIRRPRVRRRVPARADDGPRWPRSRSSKQTTEAASSIYALTDADWQPDPVRRTSSAGCRARARARQTEVHRSLELGAFSILSGTGGGIGAGSAAELPAVEIGSRRFPFRPAMQEAWHIPLRAEAAARAAETVLGGPDLVGTERHARRRARRQVHAVVDRPDRAGGSHHREQPTTTYDFARSLRVALREYAPDVILLPGPGPASARSAPSSSWPRATAASGRGPSSRRRRPVRRRSCSRCADDRAQHRAARPARPGSRPSGPLRHGTRRPHGAPAPRRGLARRAHRRRAGGAPPEANRHDRRGPGVGRRRAMPCLHRCPR